LIWSYRNSLKSHKTTKTFFGKSWHWNHTSLEILGESLERGGQAASRKRPGGSSSEYGVIYSN
jgi:hypothetical protein